MLVDGNGAALKPDPEMATAFLKHLYGGLRQGWLAIVSFPGPRTRFFDLGQPGALEQAAKFGCGLSSIHDVYYCIGLLKERPASGRGSEALVIGVPTPIDTLWITDQLGRKPSFAVHTGHGWQCYWSLDQFWQFGDDQPARAKARQFSDRLQALLRRIAANRKWSLDATSDLVRLLRLPGTINHKDRTAKSLVTFEVTGPRYDRGEFLKSLDDRDADKVGSGDAAQEEGPQAGFVGSDGFVEGGPFPEHRQNAAGTPPQEVPNDARGSRDDAPAPGIANVDRAAPAIDERTGDSPPTDSGTAGEDFPPAVQGGRAAGAHVVETLSEIFGD